MGFLDFVAHLGLIGATGPLDGRHNDHQAVVGMAAEGGNRPVFGLKPLFVIEQNRFWGIGVG